MADVLLVAFVPVAAWLLLSVIAAWAIGRAIALRERLETPKRRRGRLHVRL